MNEGRERRHFLALVRVRPVLVVDIYRLEDIVEHSIVFRKVTIVLSIDIIHISIVVTHEGQLIVPARYFECEKILTLRR